MIHPTHHHKPDFLIVLVLLVVVALTATVAIQYNSESEGVWGGGNSIVASR